MKLRYGLMALLLGWSYFSWAQTVSDFEGLLTDPETFLNGDDESGGFEVGNIFLTNSYDTDFAFWSGWAISNTTDVTSPGFFNQYSCIAGAGLDGSSSYAVAYVSGNSIIHTRNSAEGGIINGFYINNSTYAYLSMLEGDAFAKKFGGENGTDPDFLYVTIKKFGAQAGADSLNVYLADYTSDDPQEDYLLSDWTYVDLSGFGDVDTLSFEMHSSDIGSFGINTPTYFCVDNIETADMTTSVQPELSSLTPEAFIYPNPTSSRIQFSEPVEEVVIYDVQGRRLLDAQQTRTAMDLSGLQNGLYKVVMKTAGGVISHRNLIKQ